ncbi:MAG TPA: hypothetical protein VH914_07600 [Acidimicrobiia bacterium]|nr:hypothetical protein [Acidimicrobiia bacterium]
MTVDLGPVKVVGADTHLTERRDLWTSRAPAKLDFPHPTRLYPDPLATAAANMADLDASTRAKILGGNAVRLYGL